MRILGAYRIGKRMSESERRTKCFTKSEGRTENWCHLFSYVMAKVVAAVFELFGRDVSDRARRLDGGTGFTIFMQALAR